jgi:hypothetical protein
MSAFGGHETLDISEGSTSPHCSSRLHLHFVIIMIIIIRHYTLVQFFKNLEALHPAEYGEKRST